MARHYDELDVFYRELWGESLHHGLWLRGDEDVGEATENLTRLVAERAAIKRGDRVCDVGCGYGEPARFLARHYGATVVAMTVSRRQYQVASAHREAPEVQVLLGDWLENPFPSAAFQAVVAMESASHMVDRTGFLRQCRRVLVPGGRFVLSAWLAAPHPTWWQRRHLLAPICHEGRLAGLATEAEYVRELTDSGLGLLKVEDLSRGVRRTWSVCLQRMIKRLLEDADARSYLFDPSQTERGFAVTVLRMWLAYRTGALRYGVFTALAA